MVSIISTSTLFLIVTLSLSHSVLTRTETELKWTMEMLANQFWIAAISFPNKWHDMHVMTASYVQFEVNCRY